MASNKTVPNSSDYNGALDVSKKFAQLSVNSDGGARHPPSSMKAGGWRSNQFPATTYRSYSRKVMG